MSGAAGGDTGRTRPADVVHPAEAFRDVGGMDETPSQQPAGETERPNGRTTSYLRGGEAVSFGTGMVGLGDMEGAP